MLKNVYFLQKKPKSQEGPRTDGVRGLPATGHQGAAHPARLAVATSIPGMTGTGSVSTVSSKDQVVTAPRKEGCRPDKVK